jgi:hypothetical protein
MPVIFTGAGTISDAKVRACVVIWAMLLWGAKIRQATMMYWHIERGVMMGNMMSGGLLFLM